MKTHFEYVGSFVSHLMMCYVGKIYYSNRRQFLSRFHMCFPDSESQTNNKCADCHPHAGPK